MMMLLVSYTLAIIVTTFFAVLIRHKLTPTLTIKEDLAEVNLDQRMTELEQGVAKILRRMEKRDVVELKDSDAEKGKASVLSEEFTTPGMAKESKDS